MWGVFGYWGLGVLRGWGTRSCCSNSGYHDLGLLQVDFISFLCTCVKVGFYSYAKDILLLVVLVTDRLCGLVVRVSGYRYRGPGFDPRRYQIF